MAERPEIAPLIERLEQASEGDEDLDEQVALAVGWTKRGTTFPDPCDMWHEPGMAAHVEHRRPPHFTTSLDAAMTLVPEGMAADVHIGPGAIYSQATVWRPVRGEDEQGRRTTTYEPYKAGEPKYGRIKPNTPALAVCVACLRARAEAAPR